MIGDKLTYGSFLLVWQEKLTYLNHGHMKLDNIVM